MPKRRVCVGQEVELRSRSVTAYWSPGPLRCDVTVDGFTVPVDEPEAAGGTGLAPPPTGMFLASVASCFALALVHSADERGIVLGSVRVNAVGHYAGHRFDAVHLGVDVIGPNPQDLKDLIGAAERVCYVTNTLRRAVNVTVAVDPLTQGRA